MRYIGIDPGTGGAIAVIRKNKVRIYDVPTKMVKWHNRRIKEYDIEKCVDLMVTIAVRNCTIYLERVHAIPITSKISNFAMGRGRGIWEGILGALGLEFETVAPATWKKEFWNRRKSQKGKSDKRKKRADVRKALKLFPQSEHYFKLRKHHDRADALLIAEYGRRHARNNSKNGDGHRTSDSESQQ